jgi:hypothetical protein
LLENDVRVRLAPESSRGKLDSRKLKVHHIMCHKEKQPLVDQKYELAVSIT